MIKTLLYASLILFPFSSFTQGWTQRANFGGTARSSAVGFAIGTRGYVGTGHDGACRNDFWRYNQNTDTWTQMANFGGVARSGGVGFSIGNRGYIGLGHSCAAFLNDFWEYDTTNNVWTQRANFGGAARNIAAGFSIGNFGYVCAGRNGGTLYRDLWEYDPNTGVNGTWTQRANFGGVARRWAAGFSIGTDGYVGMGWNGGVLQDFWRWDQGTDTWTQIANFGGSARQEVVAFGMGTFGIVGLGFDTGARDDVWQYDPGPNTWTQLCNFGGGVRHGNPVGLFINGRGYVGLGSNPTAQQDFWEVEPNCGGLLPVELLSFSAKWQDDTYQAALLEWETANEVNNHYFEIQKSLDGLNFTAIAQVDGAGNSSDNISYEQLDTEPYVDGVSYYRLKQVDFDGTFSYSNIEALNLPEEFEITNLFPNPVSTDFQFILQSRTSTDIEVTILNAIGQVVRKEQHNITSGESTFNINVDELNAGNYYLQVRSNSGLHQAQRKFTINTKKQ